MGKNDMLVVDALVPHVRARLEAHLAQHTVPCDAADVYPRLGDDGAVDRDTLVPSLRKRALFLSSSTLSKTSEAAVWTRILSMVFRRFAGHLVVKGKLLNHEELLVSHFCRPAGVRTIKEEVVEGGHDACVHIPTSLSLRFIVQCEDAPVERIGQGDVLARVKARSYSGSSSQVAATCSVDASSLALLWSDSRLLTELDTLYGFDVKYLLQSSSVPSSVTGKLADENEDAANAVIARTSAFHDLRYTQEMMRSYGMIPTDKATAELQSFAAAMRDDGTMATTMKEDDPRSYISLGKAQKKCWSDERFAHGQELIATGRTKEALVELSSCLALDEEHVAARFARGKVLSALQQFSDAIQDFEAVLKLDPAFPLLDAALSRARGKLTHSRRVDPPSAVVSLKRRSYSKDRVEGSEAPVKNDETVEDGASRQEDRDGASRRVHSSSSSSVSTAKLEKDRLRQLLEDEEDKKKRERRRRRRRASRYSESDDDRYSSSEDDDRRKRRKKSSSSKKSKKSKSRHDKEKKSSSRKKKAKKSHKKSKRRNGSVSSSPSSEHSSSSDSDRSKRTHQRDASKRKFAGGDDSSGEAPHPILARQRHRIWN